MLFWDIMGPSLWKSTESSPHLAFKLHLFSWIWMFHEVKTKRCEEHPWIDVSVKPLLLCVNEWLTWGHLMLLYLSALLKNCLALRGSVNDEAMVHFQRAKNNHTVSKHFCFSTSRQSDAVLVTQLVKYCRFVLSVFLRRITNSTETLLEKQQVVILASDCGFFLLLQKRGLSSQACTLLFKCLICSYSG